MGGRGAKCGIERKRPRIRVKPHYDDIVKRRKANEISVSAGNP